MIESLTRRNDCVNYQFPEKPGDQRIVTLHEIIQDIHGLETELSPLERRYGLLSADFYHLYKADELEQTHDFIL